MALIGVLTLGGLLVLDTFDMISSLAHALGIVFGMYMGAFCDQFSIRSGVIHQLSAD